MLIGLIIKNEHASSDYIPDIIFFHSNLFSESIVKANSCLEIKKIRPDVLPGIYSTHTKIFGEMEVFWDMTTDSGGWTLVWSYNFTRYELFDDSGNAVSPIPNWNTSGTNVARSTTPPTR